MTYSLIRGLLFANPDSSIVKLNGSIALIQAILSTLLFLLIFISGYYSLSHNQNRYISEARFGCVPPGSYCRSLDGVVFFNFDRRHGARFASLLQGIYRNYPTPGDRNSLHIQDTPKCKLGVS